MRLRDGGLRKSVRTTSEEKGLFPPVFWIFHVPFRPSGKGRTKGRKRATKARFRPISGKVQPDTPLNPHLLHPHLRQPKAVIPKGVLQKILKTLSALINHPKDPVILKILRSIINSLRSNGKGANTTSRLKTSGAFVSGGQTDNTAGLLTGKIPHRRSDHT